jgi:hypothetical protein
MSKGKMKKVEIYCSIYKQQGGLMRHAAPILIDECIDIEPHVFHDATISEDVITFNLAKSEDDLKDILRTWSKVIRNYPGTTSSIHVCDDSRPMCLTRFESLSYTCDNDGNVRVKPMLKQTFEVDFDEMQFIPHPYKHVSNKTIIDVDSLVEFVSDKYDISYMTYDRRTSQYILRFNHDNFDKRFNNESDVIDFIKSNYDLTDYKYSYYYLSDLISQIPNINSINFSSDTNPILVITFVDGNWKGFDSFEVCGIWLEDYK